MVADPQGNGSRMAKEPVGGACAHAKSRYAWHMVWEARRARSGSGGRRASALLMLALAALALRCGGESVKQGGPAGSAGRLQPAGGGDTGGNGVGGSAVGGTGMGASGGGAGKGGAGGTGNVGGMSIGGMVAAGATGGFMSTGPFAHCMIQPLVNGSSCSFEATCEVLGCGAPWARQGADGCLRRGCDWDFSCDDGERCIHAPVAGAFDDSLTVDCESCELHDGQCGCTCLEGVESFRAVCLSRSEFPPAMDCPIDGLSCAELAAAANVVNRYRNHDDLFEPQEALDLCFEKIADRRSTQCEAGAGGEGDGS
jgi:hypothetical protein